MLTLSNSNEPQRRQQHRLPGGLAGAAFWLALSFGLLWALRHFHVIHGRHLGILFFLLGVMQILIGAAFIGVIVPLSWRLVHKHLLWSLRNKLVLTYLLIGFAPVVMLLTFVAISAYIAAGQFSIHLADTRMKQQLEEMGEDNVTRVSRLARVLSDRAQQPTGQPPARRPGPPGRGGPGGGQGGGQRGGFQGRPQRGGPGGPGGRGTPAASQAQTDAQAAAQAAAEAAAAQAATQTVTVGEAAPNPLLARLHRHNALFLNGQPSFLGQPPGPPGANGPQPQPAAAQEGLPAGLPAWATDLHGDQFRGLVLDGRNLYLVAIDQSRVQGGGLLTGITSLPVDSSLMEVVAQGLGRVQLSELSLGVAPRQQPAGTGLGRGPVGPRPSLQSDLDRASVSGGTEPDPVHFIDLGVVFPSTMDITLWQTGLPDSVPIEVHSRPSQLYRQLFGASLHGVVTTEIRVGLVALCIVFALIELLALWMALRLGRDITISVEELYAATQRVDHGDFVHRIPAAHAGGHDQLGELALSFNGMTGSLERLMVEQKEKERLQSELSIAQEVQANLFPHDVRNLPTLELHGICRPARSVSGDYYDFLVFHHPSHPDGTPGSESGVGIALGDISGKGISAALLMATLHSAVRAYRLAGEDLVYSDSTLAALTVSREGLAGDSGKLFESPGRILSMLNRHLYRSTQPEKYATLFLAHYDADTAQLTYSNAGHLPPLVLSRNGSVRRLDCGGTVVGLMDGMRYEEGRFQMNSGDILVAYSDGVTEPENEFGEFGEARLMEIVTRNRDQPLEVISAQVMRALDAWIGSGEQPDDIMLVLARQA